MLRTAYVPRTQCATGPPRTCTSWSLGRGAAAPAFASCRNARTGGLRASEHQRAAPAQRGWGYGPRRTRTPASFIPSAIPASAASSMARFWNP
jgi:hypothetical protein